MPPNDIAGITLSEQDARDLLKAAEAYFLYKAELDAFEAEYRAIQANLSEALLANQQAQGELNAMTAANTQLLVDLEQLKTIVASKDENWKAQLSIEKSRRWRWTLYGVAGGIVLGIVLGAAIK